MLDRTWYLWLQMLLEHLAAVVAVVVIGAAFVVGALVVVEAAVVVGALVVVAAAVCCWITCGSRDCS